MTEKSDCSDSNLTKVEMGSANDTYYTSDCGNYLRSETGELIFYPKKDKFTKNDLLEVIQTINNIIGFSEETNKHGLS